MGNRSFGKPLKRWHEIVTGNMAEYLTMVVVMKTFPFENIEYP
jgi:hypothetical protein